MATAHNIGNDTVMPRIRHVRPDCSPGCTADATLPVIGGKGKGVIVFHPFERSLRFNEPRRRVATVTRRMPTVNPGSLDMLQVRRA
jgi:DNA-binding HxlR family transcriptional regulator